MIGSLFLLLSWDDLGELTNLSALRLPILMRAHRAAVTRHWRKGRDLGHPTEGRSPLPVPTGPLCCVQAT